MGGGLEVIDLQTVNEAVTAFFNAKWYEGREKFPDLSMADFIQFRLKDIVGLLFANAKIHTDPERFQVEVQLNESTDPPSFQFEVAIV